MKTSLIVLALITVHAVACSSGRFSNPDYMKPIDKNFLDVLRWRLTANPANWPDWVESEDSQMKFERNRRGELSATFINHATVLIQIDGYNILTDPIWSQRTSPVSFAGPQRVRDPGIKFKNLPPIDAVVISHSHYDHMDIPTLKKLYQHHRPHFFVGLGKEAILNRHGIDENIYELDWHESFTLNQFSGPLEITFMPVRHWSARGLFDRNQTLWGGYIVKGERSVYFAGDTGYSPHFQKAGEEFGPFDLALLPIGAYQPQWFMQSSHINPQEALLAHIELQARYSMAIHFGTFQLSDEGRYEPHFDLKKAIREYQQKNPDKNIRQQDFIVPTFGGYYSFN